MTIFAYSRLRPGRWLVGAAFACGALAVSAATFERTLDNGLTVIVKEDHRAPTVAHMVWYRAGSIDEANGTTGVAHVLEHMMFKGTQNVPQGEFSKKVAAAGGRDNAFTNRDYTAYFQQIEKSKLAQMMELEADRMANLIIDATEFGKEIKVVMEERRWRTDDKAQSMLYETLQAAAYQSHPYHHPVIGWMADLESMSWHDAQAWYQRWYAPNNAFVVVVGDVQAAEVFALAQKYYGALAAKPLPQRKPQQEPVQRGIKRVTVKAPAELPYLMMAYKVPVLRNPDQDWEPYALSVLSGVLDGHEAARLSQSLVRERQLASSVGASYDSTSRGPGLLMVDGTPSEGKSVAELEAALRGELERLKAEPVSPQEINRVKAQIIAAHVYHRDSFFGQALEIGQTETAGISYRDIDKMLDKLKEVTPEQVRAVAAKYFIDDGLTVAVLDPQPLDGKKPTAPPKGIKH